jgi:hypothetical protein
MGQPSGYRAAKLCGLGAALLALAYAACGDNFEKQSQIVGLRVLGVQAEPAELILQDAGPLPSTTFTAFAIEPSGAPITTVFSLCLQQGVLPDPALACPGDAGLQLPDSGPLSAQLDLNQPAVQAVAIAFAQGQDGGSSGTGDGGVASLLAAGVPIVVGFSADAPAHGNPDGGPGPTAGYTDQHLIGFTDITLRTASAANPINHNPQLAQITADQVPIAADGSSTFHVSQTVSLVPVPAAGAKEPLSDGGVESLDYSFYTTSGSLADLRSTDTTLTGEPGIISSDYTAPAAPGPVRLWIVVRDGRGGIGWLERDFNIVP